MSQITTDTAAEPTIESPTTPGWYIYTPEGSDEIGPNNFMMFLLDRGGQWHCIFDNGDSSPCVWDYIEQALGVFDLTLVAPLR